MSENHLVTDLTNQMWLNNQLSNKKNSSQRLNSCNSTETFVSEQNIQNKRKLTGLTNPHSFEMKRKSMPLLFQLKIGK